MTAAKQRNACPSWCRLTVHDYPLRHLSTEVKIGDRRRYGQLTLWLEKHAHGPTRLAVNAAHMPSTTIELERDDAAKACEAITALLELADGT